MVDLICERSMDSYIQGYLVVFYFIIEYVFML